MLVVHGAWLDRSLAVWAEDTARDGTAAERGAHPFAATAADLLAALRLPTGTPVSELMLRLPGSATTPQPSPESGIPGTVRAPKVRGWRVPAVVVPSAEALPLLARLTGTALPVPADVNTAETPADLDASRLAALPLDAAGVDAAGPETTAIDTVDSPADQGERGVPEWGPALSLRYLAAVAETAVDLVARGRVLPQLVTEDGSPAARWRPVALGADAATWRDLVTAMPPVCLAAQAGDEITAGDLLRAALEALTDAAVRRAHPDRLVLLPRPGARTPLIERWIVALTGPDASLPDPATPAAREELRDLSSALRAWLASTAVLDAPIRVCLRLVEPGPDSEEWRLEFALQAADDPSLYVPAELVWSGAAVPGLPPRADELLLAGLGRAARLYPDLYRALEEARPTGLTVDTAWAFGFLRVAAPLLHAAGFGVQLPGWAGRRNLGLKLTTRSRTGPKAATDQGFGLAELVDFRFDLAVGDHTIGEAELAELARLKVPLVRVRGRWVELDSGQLRAALSLMERRRSGTMTVDEAIREVAGGGEAELPLVDVDADGVLGRLLAEGDGQLSPVPTPAAFQGVLRPYQERGLSWLVFLSRLGLGGILADDMGLGKTAQTLSLLLAERAAGPVAPTLLVCPMSLVSNWQKEAQRFAPSLTVYVHHGSGRGRGEDLGAAVGGADLVITTYGTALRDLDELRGFAWGRLVCDEAQAIKNSAARQAQTVRSLPARTRLALTGTPVENHLAELWSIMEFCNPGLLGPARRFRERFQVPIETRDDADAAAALRRATGPFVLRRLKTDKTIISDLPEKMEMTTWCPLTPEQASLYQAVLTEMMEKIDSTEGIERRGNVLATMTRLKQVCNHPAHLLKDGSKLAGRSGKLARLEELAAEILAEGDKALVFTQYAEFGSLLRPYLSAHLDRPVLWLHGGLSKSARDELVERFQHDDEPMLFLLSLKAAGTGLNLTAASHVIHVDRWWNPAVENQATDRAFRIGQTKNVQVRKFICAGTLEERIDEMIERKKALAERVVGTGEDWITDLSTAQLRDLFRLDPSAVS